MEIGKVISDNSDRPLSLTVKLMLVYSLNGSRPCVQLYMASIYFKRLYVLFPRFSRRVLYGCINVEIRTVMSDRYVYFC